MTYLLKRHLELCFPLLTILILCFLILELLPMKLFSAALFYLLTLYMFLNTSVERAGH